MRHDPDPNPHAELREPDRSSDELVDRLFRAVLADRRQIEAEARAWDADPVGLPPALRGALSVPAPTPDFVERTTARVVDARARRGADDAAISRALSETAGWPSSPDFVDRTFAALRVERSPLRLVDGAEDRDALDDADRDVAEPHADRSTTRSPRVLRQVSGGGPAPSAGAGRRPWVALAAAALMLVSIGAWALARTGRAAPSAQDPLASAPELPTSAVPSSLRSTPFGAALERAAEADEAGVRFEPVDPLLWLALGTEGNGG